MYDNETDGMVTGYPADHRNGVVIMECGYQILEEDFYNICVVAIDDGLDAQRNLDEGRGENRIDRSNMGHGAQAGDEIINQMMGSMGEHGIPTLGAPGMDVMGGAPIPSTIPENPMQTRNQPQIHPKMEIKRSPIIQLIDEAKLKEKVIPVSVSIPLLDTKLFRVLEDSYGEKEMEMVVEHLIDKFGIKALREALVEKLNSHYHKNKKNVQQD